MDRGYAVQGRKANLTNFMALTVKMEVTDNTVNFRDNQAIDLTTVCFYVGNRSNEVIRQTALLITMIKRNLPTNLMNYHIELIEETMIHLLRRFVYIHSLDQGFI